MIRFKVACKSIRWNRKTFHAGEYLPESFTEKDKYRVLYPSRIIKVDEEVKETVEEVPKTEGTKSAANTPVAPVKPTGAALSGLKNKSK